MPRRFEKVTTYERLRRYQAMFMAEQDGIELVIVGRPGLAKSKSFLTALQASGKRFVLLRGNQTAFSMYRSLHQGCDLPVVLDDVDDALTDARKKNLLKEVLENDDVKIASWGTSATHRDEDGNELPKSFATRSRFCVLGNKITGHHEANLGAILSRAFCIEFAPTIHEVHAYVAEWFPDEEIHWFVGQNLPLIIAPDIRDYVQALKFKRHGEDWRDMLLARWLDDPQLVVVARIESDRTLATFDQRVSKFMSRTGKSRRTFAYHLAELRRLRGTAQPVKAVAAEQIKLRNPVPDRHAAPAVETRAA
jgi:hypothetical protein